ncbi:hypothetical protein [Candidatus Ichthyocystis hellenicum]|nr:hypothetical protein [Candidatus Ichthyocystis hellenicum]
MVVLTTNEYPVITYVKVEEFTVAAGSGGHTDYSLGFKKSFMIKR